MHSFSAHALFTATLLLSVASVFGANADPIALATVKQQFINAKIVPDVIPSFSPAGILDVSFNGSSTGFNDGDAIAKENVQTQPTVNVVGISNATAKYTLLQIDGNYVGSTNPQGLNLHWLQNNVVISSSGATSNTSAATIPYAGPAPASGSGPHRYTILLFQQPSNFTAPASPAPNSGVHEIDLATYVAAAGLTGPVGGIYYTVEVGTATVTVGSTTAVNAATLSIATSTTAASGTGTTHTTSASATHTSGAAVKVGPAALGGSLMGLFGMVALLA